MRPGHWRISLFWVVMFCWTTTICITRSELVLHKLQFAKQFWKLQKSVKQFFWKLQSLFSISSFWLMDAMLQPWFHLSSCTLSIYSNGANNNMMTMLLWRCHNHCYDDFKAICYHSKLCWLLFTNCMLHAMIFQRTCIVLNFVNIRQNQIYT